MPFHGCQEAGPCESCHAGCCRSFAVPLSGADILRIERDLKISFWEFVCRWADPEGKIAQKHAPHFHFADEPETPFVICLLHEQSRFHIGTTKCRFLMESPPDGEFPLGLARCGIYSSRPGACRAFPTKLSETGDLAIIYDVPEKGRDEEHIAYELCPREWKPENFDPIETIQDLVVARYEMNYFHFLAEEWNQAPGDWEIFPEFLLQVYSRRVLHESDVQDDGPVTIPFPTIRNQKSAKAA